MPIIGLFGYLVTTVVIIIILNYFGYKVTITKK